MSQLLRSIRRVRASRRRRRNHESVLNRGVDAIARFSGSLSFVVIHVVWFTGWIVLNLLPGRGHFDPFPFGLLTLIVSLEAIFLSTFVLITQNRESDLDDQRELADFRTDIVSETWSKMIGEKLGIDPDEVQRRAEAELKTFQDRERKAGHAGSS